MLSTFELKFPHNKLALLFLFVSHALGFEPSVDENHMNELTYASEEFSALFPSNLETITECYKSITSLINTLITAFFNNDVPNMRITIDVLYDFVMKVKQKLLSLLDNSLELKRVFKVFYIKDIKIEEKFHANKNLDSIIKIHLKKIYLNHHTTVSWDHILALLNSQRGLAVSDKKTGRRKYLSRKNINTVDLDKVIFQNATHVIEEIYQSIIQTSLDELQKNNAN
jgi:hypothetical protein